MTTTTRQSERDPRTSGWSLRLDTWRSSTGSWRPEARSRIETLRLEWEETPDPALPLELVFVEDYLADPSGLVDWASGSRIAHVWSRLHSLEERLVSRLHPDVVAGRCDEYLAHVRDLLPPSHHTVRRVEDLRTRDDSESRHDLSRAVVRMLRAFHAAEHRLHRDARVLRNLLLAISMALLLLTVAVLVLQRAFFAFALIEVGGPHADEPHWQTLAAVMTAGGLGACVSGIPSLTRSTSGRTWYRLTPYQVLLKVALGPVCAVAGTMLALGGLAGLGTYGMPALIGMAVVFGACQETVSRYADRRADEIAAPVGRDSAAR